MIHRYVCDSHPESLRDFFVTPRFTQLCNWVDAEGIICNEMMRHQMIPLMSLMEEA